MWFIYSSDTGEESAGATRHCRMSEDVEARGVRVEEASGDGTVGLDDGRGDEKEECLPDLLERALVFKEEGNKLHRLRQHEEAVECYSNALRLTEHKTGCEEQRALFFANRAAAMMEMGRSLEAAADCTEALACNPQYAKALLRRAHAHEALGKPREALADARAVVSQHGYFGDAEKMIQHLEPIVHDLDEKQKEEMISKLKDLGSSVLGKFGLSLDDFQMKKDEQTGSYSINFGKNKPREDAT